MSQWIKNENWWNKDIRNWNNLSNILRVGFNTEQMLIHIAYNSNFVVNNSKILASIWFKYEDGDWEPVPNFTFIHKSDTSCKKIEDYVVSNKIKTQTIKLYKDTIKSLEDKIIDLWVEDEQ